MDFQPAKSVLQTLLGVVALAAWVVLTPAPAPAADAAPAGGAPAQAPAAATPVKPVNRCANNYVCDLLIDDHFSSKAEIIKTILRAIDIQIGNMDETREISWSKLRNAQWAMAVLGGVTTAGMLLHAQHPILVPVSVVAGTLIMVVGGYHGLVDYPHQASNSSAALARLRTLRSRINYELFKAVYFDDKARISEERIDEWYREFNRIAPEGSAVGVPTPED